TVGVTAGACSSSNTAATTTTVNAATAEQDIAAAYCTVFNFQDKTVATKIAVIQNGATITGSFSDALNSSLSSAATGSKIDTTDLLTSAQCTTQKLPSPCAKITYDLLGAGGSSLLAAQTGYAVDVNGKWLVAHLTICTLLGLFYNAEGKAGSPPGC
ncbi:MAG TPA: hypothetical protein VKR22_01720, partial [Acidimicrobiales bacterium]|nr:hypothetical protein [Acidimicrobiales bacterium]